MSNRCRHLWQLPVAAGLLRAYIAKSLKRMRKVYTAEGTISKSAAGDSGLGTGFRDSALKEKGA